jgi:cephalosporin-C deacetylase-like acetyl esterase
MVRFYALFLTPEPAMYCRVAVLAACLFSTTVPAADTTRGDRMFDSYFRRQTEQIADACLASIKTRADWELERPKLRRQFFEMMGLWPLPERTDLKPVVTGKVDTELFTIEKLHFQSIPGLYVTANLYVPKKAKFPAPAVLYVCGHGGVTVNKEQFGNKVYYQHHPAWLAEHGYVCLILDTLELGELPGEHHGTYRAGMWWWQTLGYTPAGIELWNAIRALDYLETREEVDPWSIGVTGRSGGGATSWWVGAADDRVRCIIPVAGIADLKAHVVEGVADRYRKGVISGHCDCMYFVNTYRWDFATVAALCAPRPLMLGNSDADDIFPVPGYRRLYDKARRIYDLYGASDRFVLLETKGPHKDTPELRRGAFGWLNKWLKGETGEVTEREYTKLEPQKLKVFDRPPSDAINATVHESFISPAVVKYPNGVETAGNWWKRTSEQLKTDLLARCFRGWPGKPPPLSVKPAGEVKGDGLRVRAYDFTSEDGIDLRLWLLTHEDVEKPKGIVVTVADEALWGRWASECAPAFREIFQIPSSPKRNEARTAETKALEEFANQMMAGAGMAGVWIAPRGIGPTRSAEAGTPADVHIKRRFALLGQTLDGQRVWDVRRGLAVLRTLDEIKGAEVMLSAKDQMAGVALYAAIFEPNVSQVVLTRLPTSHRQGPTFLNVRRVLDTPQAVALMFPRKVILYQKDPADKAWDWPLQLERLLGDSSLKIRKVAD